MYVPITLSSKSLSGGEKNSKNSHLYLSAVTERERQCESVSSVSCCCHLPPSWLERRSPILLASSTIDDPSRIHSELRSMFVLKKRSGSGFMSMADWQRTVVVTLFFGALVAVKLAYVDKRLK